jgi:hypothetical protein
LTREVFLPDQSAAHTKSSNKCWQALFQKNSVEICAYLWKKISAKTNGTIHCSRSGDVPLFFA